MEFISRSSSLDSLTYNHTRISLLRVIAVDDMRQSVPVEIHITEPFHDLAVLIVIGVTTEGSFNTDVQVDFTVMLMDEDLIHQKPQVRFGQLTFPQDFINEADILFQLGLTVPKHLSDILQLFDLLFCRRNFGAALSFGAVILLFLLL